MDNKKFKYIWYLNLMFDTGSVLEFSLFQFLECLHKYSG